MLVVYLANLSQKKPCDIAGRISKHSQLRTSRHFGRQKDGFASKTLYPIKRCLQILDPHIYGNAFVPFVRGANTPIDASWSSFGLDDAVFHWVVAVYLPSKKLTVKRLEFGAFSAHDFEMNHRCAHRSPSLHIIRRLEEPLLRTRRLEGDYNFLLPNSSCIKTTT